MSLILDGTNGLSDVDGTAAAPAIRGTDTNTGIFFGTDIIGFSEGGVEAMRIDASGNVGIGGTVDNHGGYERCLQISATAGAVLELEDSSSYSYLAQNGTTLQIRNNATAGAMTFATEGTERARIDSSGNLLVGKTASTSSTVGAELLPTATAGYIASFTSDAQRAVIANRLTSDGELYSMRRSGTVVGTISVTTTATAYNTSSDYRLKESIAPMTGALAKVALLKPCTYKWKVDGSDGQGFIAHELAEVEAGCVTGEKDAVDAEGNPQYQGIDTSFLVATLTAAIQELKAIVDAQGAEIIALKGAAA